MMKFLADKASIPLGLLGLLMASHLTFLGFGALHCRELNLKALERGESVRPQFGLSEEQGGQKRTIGEGCSNYTDTFQSAAETYIAIILALMAPLPKR